MHSGIQHLPRKIKKEKGGEGKEEPFSIKRVPDGNVLVSKRVKSVKWFSNNKSVEAYEAIYFSQNVVKMFWGEFQGRIWFVDKSDAILIPNRSL